MIIGRLNIFPVHFQGIPHYLLYYLQYVTVLFFRPQSLIIIYSFNTEYIFGNALDNVADQIFIPCGGKLKIHRNVIIKDYGVKR